jgi:biotin carboxyl carrier protein
MAPTSNGSDPLLEHAGLSQAELERVLALVAGTDVVELEISFGSGRLSLRRSPGAQSVPTVPTPPAPAQELEETSSLAITSPLVGIFQPAVGVGETVQTGQSIGAIEALGMPTSVDAPQSGTVEQLLVQSGSPVEYGQPLLLLRRTRTPAP